MKKTLYVLGAALALVACAKEAPVVEESPLDASKLTFNFTVNQIDNADTKAVKTAWANGDVVYVFFEDNTTNYIKMVYDGSDWACLDKEDGVDFAGLTLSESGKKLTAVYLPYNTDAPAYDEGWTFADTYSYYLTSGAESYTVNTGVTPNVVTATLNMAKPFDSVQIFIPDTDPVAGKYVLLESHITPKTCGKIIGGSAITPTTKTAGYVMPCNIIDEDTEADGYYFYGTIASKLTDETFDFSLVQVDPTYGYAIGTQTLHSTSKTLDVNDAKKITYALFSAQQPWVDLGLSVKWATGYLKDNGTSSTPATSGSICLPNEVGKYYAFAATTGYTKADGHAFSKANTPYYNSGTGEYIKYIGTTGTIESGDDAAVQLLPAGWRLPTGSEAEEFQLKLKSSGLTLMPLNVDYEKHSEGYFLCANGVNGLKTILVNQGWLAEETSWNNCDNVIYTLSEGTRFWTSSYNSDGGIRLYGKSNVSATYNRFFGFALRPVYTL